MAAASQRSEQSFQQITSQFMKSIDLLLTSAKDLNLAIKKDDELQEKLFWEELAKALDLLPHEVYKVTLLFAQPPYPTLQESSKILEGLEKCTMGFFRIVHGAPHFLGQTLLTKLKKKAVYVLEAILAVARALNSNESEKMLVVAAQVEESCFSLGELPKSNKKVIQHIFEEQLELVVDALSELSMEIANEPPQEQPPPTNGYCLPPAYHLWTNAESDLLKAARGLVKCARGILKKTSSAILQRDIEIQHNALLDELGHLAESTSDAVDSLVMECNHPLCYQTIRNSAMGLKDHLDKFIETLRTCPLSKIEDQKWLGILKGAVDHNIERMQSIALSMGLLTIDHN